MASKALLNTLVRNAKGTIDCYFLTFTSLRRSPSRRLSCLLRSVSDWVLILAPSSFRVNAVRLRRSSVICVDSLSLRLFACPSCAVTVNAERNCEGKHKLPEKNILEKKNY